MGGTAARTGPGAAAAAAGVVASGSFPAFPGPQAMRTAAAITAAIAAAGIFPMIVLVVIALSLGDVSFGL
jgi:hypothetical protein